MSAPSHEPPPSPIPAPADPAHRTDTAELTFRTAITPMGTLSGVSEPLLRPHWSTDGRWLAAPCHDGTIAIWDMAELALGELSFFSIYARVIASGGAGAPALTPVRVPSVGFAFSAGARIFYVPVDDDRAPAPLGEHDGAVVALASNHRYVAALGAGMLRIWDPLAPETQSALPAQALERPGGRDLAWAAGLERIAVAGDGGITILDPHDPAATVHVDIDDQVSCLAWSAQGTALAAGTQGGEIHVWEGQGRHTRALHGHLSPVSGVTFSWDDTLLASTSASGELLIWTVADGCKRQEIPEEVSALGRAPSAGLAFHPRANVLATIDSYDQLTVRLWSARLDEHRTRVPAPPRPEAPAPALASIRWQHLAPGLEPGRASRPDRARHGRGLRWQHVAPAAPALEPVAPERSARIPAPAPEAARVDLSAEALREHVTATGLLQPARLYLQIAAALGAGKHVLLLGPPGTGKTALARAVADFAARAGLSGTPHVTAASPAWSARDTIGGPAPRGRADRGRMSGSEFSPGPILQAMSAGRWLVIDGLDRAGGEAGLGELLTVMGGHPVELPHRIAGAPVRILPHRDGAGDAPGVLAGDPGAFVMDPRWRILATAGVAGQARPFPLSPALMRHFAVIDVPPPEPALFRQLVERWLDEAGDALSAAASHALAAALDRLLAPDMALMRRRPLAPAVVRDMIAYAALRARAGADPGHALLGEAFLALAAAQLEGLGPGDLVAIHRQLTTSVFPGTPAARQLGARLRALHPDIPSDAWTDT